MKNKIILALLLVVATVNAQKFGKHAIEMNYGTNIYVSPLGTSQLSPVVNVGYRYNFTPTFGLQLVGQYDMYRSQPDAHELCLYKANSLGGRLEAVKRFARVGRFAFLASAGIGGTKFYLEDDYTEHTFNYSTGMKVLYRLGEKRQEWGAINAYYGVVTHSVQDKTLNRNFDITSSGINSYVHNITVGFTIYLDNAPDKRPADWWKPYFKKEKGCCKKEIVQPITVNPVQIIKEKANSIPVETVFFDYDKSDINIQARNAIFKVANWLKNNPKYSLKIEGWACASGSEEYNYQLSKRRAEVVYVTLISLGINKDRLFFEGKGIDYDYTNELNHDFPRRVELIIKK